MAMINIPSTCKDPACRYKMPRLITKVEGRGNGIKTCIVNMGDVARALMRPPQYTTKWLGNELGAYSTYINKEREGERTFLNGLHDPAVIQTFLDKFIDKYVLCAKCHMPEVDMKIVKGNIQGKCKACGWSGDLDNESKLASFITKNPPDKSGINIVGSGADIGKSLSKEERRREKLRKKAKKDADENSWYSDSSDDDKPKSKKDKKEKKHKKEKKDKEKKDKKEKKEKKQHFHKEPEEGDFGDEEGEKEVQIKPEDHEEDEEEGASCATPEETSSDKDSDDDSLAGDTATSCGEAPIVDSDEEGTKSGIESGEGSLPQSEGEDDGYDDDELEHGGNEEVLALTHAMSGEHD